MARKSRLSPLARSVFAVVDGLLLFLALEGAFYAVAFLGLHRSFDTPTVPYLTSNLVWAVFAGLAAGYTTGRVAWRSPALHGFFTALPLLVMALLNFNKGVGGRRTGFVLIFNILVPLSVLAGAYLVQLRRRTYAGRRQ